MEVTEKMLIAAIKKAVNLGLFPNFMTTEEYTQYWDGMKEVLKVALNNAE